MNGPDIGLLGSCIAAVSSSSLPYNATLSGFAMAEERPSYRNEYVLDSTTDSINTTTSLIEKAFGDLDELATLGVDWDSYGSPKISDD